MSRFIPFMLCAAVILAGFVSLGVAQQAPATEEKPKTYAKYDDLFDDFQKRRDVLYTRFERIQQSERVAPEDLERVEGEMRALDREYAGALRAYIGANPDAADLMPARHELVVTWSRLEDRLEQAVAAADEFLEKHADAELAGDVRFMKAQALFRITGREGDTLAAIDQFIEKDAEHTHMPVARAMRVRTLLFMNRVDEARSQLRSLLERPEVKEDEEAQQHLRSQLEALDWISRDLPDFSLQTISGSSASKADFAGKPLLLVIYDSTSPACLGELPYIEEAGKTFGEKLSVFGVSINESRTAFEQWLERNKERIKFKNAWIDREQEGTLLRKLDVTLIPFNVLVDAEGKIYRYDVRSDDMLRYAELLTK